MLYFETKGNDTYDGTVDWNRTHWFNVSFLTKRYVEYNKRFFGNLLPETIPIVIQETNKSALASTNLDLLDTRTNKIVSNTPQKEWNEKFHKVIVSEIVFKIVDWDTRFQLENALIHEMCHVWQVYCGIQQNPYNYMLETEDPNKKGHGKCYSEIAKKINKHSSNFEGFVVLNSRTGDELSNTLQSVEYSLKHHLRIPLKIRRYIERNGYYIVERRLIHKGHDRTKE